MSKPQWNLLYLTGRTRWNTGITPPELVEVIEGGQIPPGRALDIGCGTGTNTIYLAKHGFQAVGVDVAFLAIIQARYKAWRLGLPVKFSTGDILKLGLPEYPVLSAPVDFALDIGCLHSMGTMHLQSYTSMLLRVLASGGFYLLYAWWPHELQGRPVGLKPEELKAALGNSFHAIWTRQGEEGGIPAFWYLFQKLS